MSVRGDSEETVQSAVAGMEVLIVEDERDLASIVADYVVAAGFAASIVADGAEAVARIRRAAPDIIVLDLALPGMDGVDVCRAVRAFSDVPIIMATARVEEIDRLLGLDTGADDYVCKPYSPRELVARIRALLRRRQGLVTSTRILEIDGATQSIKVMGRVLALTQTEFALLRAMARRPGTIHSRASLLDLCNPDGLDVSDRSIDTHIKNLRRKIADAAPGLDLIQSVYGVGYRVEF